MNLDEFKAHVEATRKASTQNAINKMVSKNETCNTCEGKGIHSEWVSSDGDYDFEWCDCNPEHLVLEEMF